MTGPQEFSVPVTVQVPLAMYGRLSSVGRRHGVSVSVLLIEAARRGLVAGQKRRKKPAVPAVPRRFWSAEDDATVIRLHGQGMSDVEIAKVVGFNQGTTSRHRDALGLPPLFPGRPKKVQP